MLSLCLVTWRVRGSLHDRCIIADSELRMRGVVDVGVSERMTHPMTFGFGGYILPTDAFDCSFGSPKSISARNCASRPESAMITRWCWIQASIESFNFVGLPQARSRSHQRVT